MATFGFKPFPGPDSKKIVHLPEGSGATFYTGDLVIFTSGYVQVATNDDDIFGIAMRNSSGTIETDIPVYVITPGDKFIAESSATIAETNKGVAYDLVMTAGSMAVNPGGTSSAAFYIERLDPRDGPTTGAGGRVIGRFIYTSMDSIGG